MPKEVKVGDILVDAHNTVSRVIQPSHNKVVNGIHTYKVFSDETKAKEYARRRAALTNEAGDALIADQRARVTVLTALDKEFGL